MITLKLISASDFKARLKKLIPFMSTEDTRYYLNGVLFSYKDGVLTLVATNGHILCCMEYNIVTEEPQPDFEVICPSRAIKHLTKVISATKETDGGLLINISEDNEIEFDFFDFKYQVSAIDGTYPSYKDVIPLGLHSLNKGLNAKYLTTVLKALDNAPVDIQVDENPGVSAHLFSSSKVEGIQCVIMPMRV